MFVCVDPEAERYVPEEDEINDWTGEMDRRIVLILGHRLKSVVEAITVRRRKGGVLITDGPFTETKEYVTGVDVLACAPASGQRPVPEGPDPPPRRQRM
jgi:hypothetical protein